MPEIAPQPETPAADPEPPSPPTHARHSAFRVAWPWVLAVIGLDYFSSLAYQPSVAFSAAGVLAPIVTVALVLVTLFLVVPLYCYLAGRSPHGGGSIALLERLLPGWIGKLLVLVLLGFAATDLVFTRTFSAADAAEHLVHSPIAPWQDALNNASSAGTDLAHQLPTEVNGGGYWRADRHVVVALLVLLIGSFLAWWFRRGVTRGLIRVAVIVLTIYLVLTGVVVGSGLAFLSRHPERFEHWWESARAGAEPVTDWHSLESWWPLVAACIVLFPRLALGLSGYELALTTMPLVRGYRTDTRHDPHGRIRNTRWMLVTAAVLMAVFLLASTLVTTILIPSDALRTEGKAANRALAYLAHGSPLLDGGELNPAFGPAFGAVYDLTTITVLTLAGVIVLIGLRDLVPPYLYRLGMDWKWSQRWGVLTYLFTLLKFGVTYAYSANLDAQRGAYLTGVLSIFAFASLAALVDAWKRRHGRWKPLRVSPLFLLSLIVFAGSTVVVIRSQPAGLILALWFIGMTLILSLATRFFRNTELRFRGFEFADDPSRQMWQDLIAKDFPIIVPVRPEGPSLAEKERDMRTYHRLPPELAVVFIRAELGDASDFTSRPVMRITREDGRVVAELSGCASIPHAIAAAALEIARQGEVPEVHFGWSNEHPLTANLNFVLFGQGNVPWMVYELIQAADFPAERKPRVLVG